MKAAISGSASISETKPRDCSGYLNQKSRVSLKHQYEKNVSRVLKQVSDPMHWELVEK